MRWRKAPEPVVTDVLPDVAPDYVEPLRAWRLWVVEDVAGEPRLRSLYRPTFWPVGVPLEAHCDAYRLRLRRHVRHTAPAESCTCGIYAVPYESIPRVALDGGELSVGAVVIGTVSLWGNVVECERGWRAEFAYPARLFVPCIYAYAAREMAAALADYGVPVDFLDARTPSAVLKAVGELAA